MADQNLEMDEGGSAAMQADKLLLDVIKETKQLAHYRVMTSFWSSAVGAMGAYQAGHFQETN